MHAIFHSHKIHARMWSHARSFKNKTCKDVGKHAQLSFTTRQEWVIDKTCAPTSFQAFTQKQMCLWSSYFLPLGTRRNMQGYPWHKKQARMGDRQNMPSLLPSWLLLRSSCASSLLAFCPTQLHAGVSGSVKSDQRHSALGPCWAQNWNWVEFPEIVPCHLYNFHSTATKWGTKLWHIPFWGWGMDQFISESFGMKWNVVKENVAHLNELNQNGSSCASQTNFGSST